MTDSYRTQEGLEEERQQARLLKENPGLWECNRRGHDYIEDSRDQETHYEERDEGSRSDCYCSSEACNCERFFFSKKVRYKCYKVTLHFKCSRCEKRVYSEKWTEWE